MQRLRFLLMMTIIVGVVVGCSSTPETKKDPMSAVWKVVQMGSKDLTGIDASMVPTMAFDPVKLKVSGSAGCNTYSGTYLNDMNAFSFGTMAVTKKACPGEAMSIESQFLDLLSHTSKMKIDGDALTLIDAGGSEILKAIAQE